MGSIWTVQPQDVRLDLVYIDKQGGTHPLWIRVKRQLNVGESRRVMTAGWKGMSSPPPRNPGDTAPQEGPRIDIDWQATSFARAETWLTDWSLEDDSVPAKKLPITREVIEALHADVFDIIENAITAHITKAGEEKKVTAGSEAPVATSA